MSVVSGLHTYLFNMSVYQLFLERGRGGGVFNLFTDHIHPSGK